MKGKEVMFIGLLMNDLISFDRNRDGDPQKRIPMGKVISKAECLRRVPGIDDNGVTGGAFWTDAQLYNSERYTLSFVLSAVDQGAVVANYVRAEGLLKKGGRIIGVKAHDCLGDQPFEIRGSQVVNTCGGWADELIQDVHPNSRMVSLSTAMNLVIKRAILPESAAGVNAKYEYKKPDGSVYHGRRVLFMTPWRHVTIIGTFHRPYHNSPDHLVVSEREIEEILREINTALIHNPIQREDVSFFYKGFLPMDGIHKKTGEVILTKHYRILEHQRQEGLEGLISVVGVKYTTARDVAEKTVDRVVRRLEKKCQPCQTQITPLKGGDIGQFTTFQENAQMNRPETITPEVMDHLIYNYGSLYPLVLKIGEKDPQLWQQVPGSKEVIRAEVVYAVREEMANTLSDVVFRRTDLGSAGHPGLPALKAVAESMGRELGWNQKRMNREIKETEASYQPQAG
jgi:glycerol-3-phosphate dehydrogenase